MIRRVSQMRKWIWLTALAAWPTGAVAHPHVFIDATIEVIFDDKGLAEGVRIGWTYDEYFSLLIIEDRGLDPDYDNVLTPEAEAKLAGFDAIAHSMLIRLVCPRRGILGYSFGESVCRAVPRCVTANCCVGFAAWRCALFRPCIKGCLARSLCGH